MKEKFFSTKNITVTATLTAISYVLYMFVKFPLPFMFPAFLDIQFSDMPALIGGFMMGPIWGCVIILVKCLLKLPFSSTSFVGELGDLIVGIAFVLPAALLYKRYRTKKGAVAALAVGTASAVVASMFANAFLLIPFFTKAYGWGAVVGMLSKLFPSVTQKSFYLYYLPLSVLPFNILRCFICSLITFFVYKHLHKLINYMFTPRTKKAAPDAQTPQESAVGEAQPAPAEDAAPSEGIQDAPLSQDGTAGQDE